MSLSFHILIEIELHATLTNHLIKNVTQISLCECFLETLSQNAEIDDLLYAAHVPFDNRLDGILSFSAFAQSLAQLINGFFRFDHERNRVTFDLVYVKEVFLYVQRLGDLKKSANRLHDEVNAAIVSIGATGLEELEVFFLNTFVMLLSRSQASMNLSNAPRFAAT